MNEEAYIGIDPALHLGLSIWIPQRGVVYSYEVKGNPLVQLAFICNKIDHLLVNPKWVGMEELHHFRNKRTVRIQLERSGYIKWFLRGYEYQVEDVNMNSVLNHFGLTNKIEAFDYMFNLVKSEKLNTNHTDSILLALYKQSLDKKIELDTIQYKLTSI